MGYLKGKSELMIFDKHTNLKYKFGNRHFWSEGYYLSTVRLNLFVVLNILLCSCKVIYGEIMTEYLSIKQTSEKWGIIVRRIQVLCTEGRIPGAT